MVLIQEVWKKVKYNAIYSVSDMGRVRNDKTGRILKPRPDRKGYCRANLQGKDYKTHRLVAEHFIPNNDIKKDQVNHIDGDKNNNKASNLEWCTGRYNVLHSYEIGLRDHLLKITDIDVSYIRENNLDYREVMDKFGLSQSHASAIVNGTRREILRGDKSWAS